MTTPPPPPPPMLTPHDTLVRLAGMLEHRNTLTADERAGLRSAIEHLARIDRGDDPVRNRALDRAITAAHGHRIDDRRLAAWITETAGELEAWLTRTPETEATT